jgi:hypothetical protein
MTAAETAIVNLGGQVPPPTGSFTLATVTWTNLTVINLSGGGTVTPAGGVQTYAGGGLYKISGVAGYNAGGSTVESIGGNSNGYFQFQMADALAPQSHSAKIGVVYEDVNYSGTPPHVMRFGGGYIDLYNPWISNHTQYIAGDWFRIRHYALDNEIHFQKRVNIGTVDNTLTVEVGAYMKFLTDWTAAPFNLPTTDEYYIGDVVQISAMSGSYPQFEGYTATRTLGSSAIRGTNWETADYLGQDYVTFYTHPISSNGSDIYLDTSFHYIGAGVNDVQIATQA